MANSDTAENQLEVSGPTALEFDIQELIRIRAFELYEGRGRIDGFAEKDWLQAETEILAPHDAAVLEGAGQHYALPSGMTK